MLDVSPATLSQIENGRTGLTVHRLSRIADALDLTPADILDYLTGTLGMMRSQADAHAATP